MDTKTRSLKKPTNGFKKGKLHMKRIKAWWERWFHLDLSKIDLTEKDLEVLFIDPEERPHQTNGPDYDGRTSHFSKSMSK